MNSKYIIYLIAPLFFLACVEPKDTEEEMPEIELIMPMACDTLLFGESFRFVANISDNVGLGNLSMDVHHNFGHHSHGDHETCNMDVPKDVVNPFEESWIFTLPEDQKEYMLDTLLILPAKDGDSLEYDTGDYHFHIYVTDTEGYLIFTTFDVKILDAK